ncbi:phage minor capsid protein [Streptomyces inhibens]|uniref:phage minor capsid protein n=1 Tax=Streptomyces inhibens TaxID=2293571 RepID=UPI0037B35F71
MLRVVVQGTLDEARHAGFQHPNCRHSVSAYLPGVSSLIPPMRSDGKSYEAGQRQRAIERNIRKHKKRAAAAVTPEAKKAAEAKVRTWQKATREHLAEHPQLRRNRTREQLGAGNLPPARTEAPQAAVEAARLRAGDEHMPGEMDEQQLADAIGTKVPDERDLDRAAAELDRRYPVAPPVMATGGTTDDYLANRAALDTALLPLRLDDPQPTGPDEWGAYGRDITEGPDGTEHMSAAERWAYEKEIAERQAQIAYTREEIREMHQEHIYLQ